MLYYLSQWTEWFSPLRVFRYITFRTLGAAATAFVVVLALGPWVIARLRRIRAQDADRMTDVPALRAQKQHKRATPTMGGVLILLAVTLSVLLWAAPGNAFTGLTLATMLFMGLVGFWDDYLKVVRRNARGLPARVKFLWQLLWTVAVVLYLWTDPATRPLVDTLMLPFLKDPAVSHLGLPLALLFIFFVLAGCTNAVNLTDGLDGLAMGCTNTVAAAYLVMAYVTGHAVFARYLQLPFVPGAGELAVFAGALLGAGLGFLWYNCHPARVFMGDTGSLALGGAIAMIAILVQQEITLVFVGGVFVMEALSVMIQTSYFRLTGGRRVFLCSPIHHHFELLEKQRAEREGRDVEVVETMITIRFWIVSILCALMGLATLKLR